MLSEIQQQMKRIEVRAHQKIASLNQGLRVVQKPQSLKSPYENISGGQSPKVSRPGTSRHLEVILEED